MFLENDLPLETAQTPKLKELSESSPFHLNELVAVKWSCDLTDHGVECAMNTSLSTRLSLLKCGIAIRNVYFMNLHEEVDFIDEVLKLPFLSFHLVCPKEF